MLELKIAGYVRIFKPYSEDVTELASQLIQYRISDEVIRLSRATLSETIAEALFYNSIFNTVDLAKDVLRACKEGAVVLHGRFCMMITLETRVLKDNLNTEYTIAPICFKVYFTSMEILKIEETDLEELIKDYLRKDNFEKICTLVTDAFDMNESLNKMQYNIKLREKQMGVKKP